MCWGSYQVSWNPHKATLPADNKNEDTPQATWSARSFQEPCPANVTMLGFSITASFRVGMISNLRGLVFNARNHRGNFGY